MFVSESTWRRFQRKSFLNFDNVKIDLDFGSDYYRLGSDIYRDVSSFIARPGVSFTRSSAKRQKRFQSEVLDTFAAGVPARNTSGLSTELTTQNFIRNPEGRGGNIGLPGNLPDNWVGPAPTTNGITREFVERTTINGVAGTVWEIAGTASALTFLQFLMESQTFAPATIGQTWTASVYWQLISGTLPQTSNFLSVIERDSGGGNLGVGVTTPLGSGSFQRVVCTRQLNAVGLAFVGSAVAFQINSDETVRFRVFIGGQNLVQQNWVTSPVVQTSTSSTSTRQNDLLTIDLSFLTGLNTSGFYIWTGTFDNADPASFPRSLQIDDGTFNNAYRTVYGPSGVFTDYTNAGTSFNRVTDTAPVLSSRMAGGVAWNGTRVRCRVNNVAPLNGASSIPALSSPVVKVGGSGVASAARHKRVLISDVDVSDTEFDNLYNLLRQESF